MHRPPLIAIAGPTASGKSWLGMEVARRIGGEILCADSRQIYRGLDIGTAKPSPADQRIVPHHLLDLCDISQTLTLAQYQAAAEQALEQVWQRGKTPILVGGTGLYIKALLYGYQIPEVPPQPQLRQRLQQLEAEGQGTLHRLLAQADDETAARLHPHDLRRIIRALEVWEITGRPISAWQHRQDRPRYPLLYLGLEVPKPLLQKRIQRRIGAMIEAGLKQEVQRLQAEYGADQPLLRTLNYGEIADYLAGKLTLPQAQATMHLHTRQYAKRQMTWFRQDAGLTWHQVESEEDLRALADFIVTKYESRNAE